MIFNKKNNNTETYCPLAWIHSFINQDGSYQVCCSSEEFDNHIRDDEGKKLFIGDSVTSQDVMNSTFMKKIRLQMLNGEWPDLCKRCKIVEDMGGISRRNIETMNYKEENKAYQAHTEEDGTVELEIKSADYRLGNLCNLQCRMCNPRSTKLWIKEWNDIKPQEEKFSDEVMESYNNYHWIDSDSLTDDFKEKAASLNHIHFAGGEPLIVPQMSHILQICIDSGNAKNIILTYNTNMTVLPPKVLELWKEFKGVKILASIDATEDLNNYIRYPANWHKIDKNLKFIDEHHEDYNIDECMLSSTVQILNILRFEELYEYLSQFKFIVPVPNLVNLHVPEYFQTTVLPPKIKAMAGIKFKNIKEKYEKRLPDHYKYLTNNIPQIVNFMNSEDSYSNGKFDEFIKFQSDFDKKRNLKLQNICPEFTAYTK